MDFPFADLDILSDVLCLPRKQNLLCNMKSHPPKSPPKSSPKSSPESSSELSQKSHVPIIHNTYRWLCHTGRLNLNICCTATSVEDARQKIINSLRRNTYEYGSIGYYAPECSLYKAWNIVIHNYFFLYTFSFICIVSFY